MRGKPLERRHGAGKGPALGGDIGLVVNQELGQHAVDVVLGAGAAQSLLDHDAGAVADALADGVERYRRVPAPRQHVVQRVGQVRRGIDQGAVEIENDSGVLEHGPLSHTRLAAWQAAA